VGLLVFNDKGIYCEKADVYIDPWRAVDRALITHGHSDHSRYGHNSYLCQTDAAPAIQHRIPKAQIQTLDYSEKISINGVEFSFHPAGHILGSSQIRVEYQGEVWVVSGDYKLESDGISMEFEPQKCHHFITESTFGLPVYRWPSPDNVLEQMKNWWEENALENRTTVFCAYSLGKAQRILKAMANGPGPIFCHGAVEDMNEVFRKQGVDLPHSRKATNGIDRNEFYKALVICPPSAINTPWFKRFHQPVVAMASGWMAIKRNRRRRATDRGFVLSDHADWLGLNKAVEMTGAENVYVTHGYADVFARWLRESKDINATTVSTLYQGDSEESEDQ
jgi:putative mRNA 3-end processing factor